jgi:hypothetical protein
LEQQTDWDLHGLVAARVEDVVNAREIGEPAQRRGGKPYDTPCAIACPGPRRSPGHLISKNKKAPGLASRGQTWGWACATRSFPAHTLGASLSRAVCSPTPLTAACNALGLMAGPSRPLLATICRVRPLRLVRPSPAGDGSPDGVQTRLRSFDLSRLHRYHAGGPGF